MQTTIIISLSILNIIALISLVQSIKEGARLKKSIKTF